MALWFGSRRSVMRAVCSHNIFSILPPPPPPPPTRHTNLHHFSHLQILDAEITSTQNSLQVIEIPDGFPFKIEEYPGLKTVSLKREYPDEVVKIKVRKGHYDFYDLRDDAIDRTIYLDVCLAKKRKGRSLESQCFVKPGLLGVESLVVWNGEHVIKGAYRCDAPLSFVFPYYLAVRGIDEFDFPKFMCEYMLNKYRREYLTWLKNVKSFMGT